MKKKLKLIIIIIINNFNFLNIFKIQNYTINSKKFNILY